jgi:hypothetical protein
MPQTFDQFGIKFQYPDNWTVDNADLRAGNTAVTIFSPGGAFWSVALHEALADPGRMAKAALEAMQKEYDSVEFEPVTQTIGKFETTGFDLNFFCFDLTSTARIRSFQLDRRTFTIFCQGEDRELAEVGRVFDAMTFSMLSGLG